MKRKIISSSCFWRESVKPYERRASAVVSVFYGLFVVLFAVVFKVSEKISSPLNEAVAESHIQKSYLCFLFSVGILWMVSFKVHNKCFRSNTKQWSKSLHASNKWLKGIVAIFGFSVVVKESLELIAINELHSDKCHDKPLYVIFSILHGMFVVGEVLFLFFYAKIHIQGIVFMSRIGIMHVMSTNLAVWISIIADETNHALAYERYHHHHTSLADVMTTFNASKFHLLTQLSEAGCNDSFTLSETIRSFSLKSLKPEGLYTGEEFEGEGLFKGPCFCHSSVCKLVSRADQILSPMLIEFCLVASCLLYVTWNNVGKKIKCHSVITKPSYKFYKSYKGVLMGVLVLLGCVVVMTLLASVDSGVDADEKNYTTEYRSLVIHDTYLALCNSVILAACVACFYAFTIVPASKKKNSQAWLDIVLLFICLVGPLLVGLFSILSFVAGPPDSKLPNWSVSLARSVTDIVVSVVQTMLIVLGFFREPSTLSLSTPKKTPHFPAENSRDDLNCGEGMKEVVTKTCNDSEFSENQKIELKELEKRRSYDEKKSISSNSSLQHAGDDALLSNVTETAGNNLTLNLEHPGIHIAVPQINRDQRNSRTMNLFQRSSPPRKTRIILRDIIMFLVISNTCLWILLSLNETAFKIFSYQKEYFGHSAWTTLSSVTAPLSMFLKLHSAACFFEIWSYT